MAQVTLNDPIDGAELKQIILARVSAALERDCTLSNDIAYAGFSLSFEIKLNYLRSKTSETLVWGNAIVGDLVGTPIDATNPMMSDTMTDSYASSSPNAAREDHSLPIPVMVQTPSGKERRKIHVNQPKAKPAPTSAN